MVSEQNNGEPNSSAIKLPSEFRMTKQRREVFDILADSKDHPTANEVFERVKSRMPSISLATVYNCLETLTSCGLINQVNLDRAPSRFCANLAEHVHFHCENCGKVVDADPLRGLKAEDFWSLPEGTKVTDLSVAIRGKCPDCANRKEESGSENEPKQQGAQ